MLSGKSKYSSPENVKSKAGRAILGKYFQMTLFLGLDDYSSPERMRNYPGSPLMKTPAPKVSAAYGFISAEELREIRGKAEKNQKADAVIIRADELADIKKRTVHKSPQ